jgi:two-component system, chemotaxis family, response regulator PixG
MNSINSLENAELCKKLIYLQEQQFTGILNIQSSNNPKWRLFFHLGKLVWSNGGEHPYRSWVRHLAKYCPQIDLNSVRHHIRNRNQFQEQDYHILSVLLQENLIKPEQQEALIKSKLSELLFDILLQESKEKLHYSTQAASLVWVFPPVLVKSLAQIPVKQVIEPTQLLWLAWVEKGMKLYSPNLAPNLKQRSQLKQEVSDTVYQNLLKWVDGKNTLRDLSFYLDKDIVKVSVSLASYIQKGFLELVKVSDLTPPPSSIESLPLKNQKPNTQVNDQEENLLGFSHNVAKSNDSLKSQQLIVCVDDSPQICKVMEQFLIRTGYQVKTIQEPLKAIPTLISLNPNLIFLDIGMPVLNGYEICIKLRQISKLKNIPVVMLTASSGILDQMRAQVVGASDFIAKPIDEEKILKVINKFLSSEGKSNEQSTAMNYELIFKQNSI